MSLIQIKQLNERVATAGLHMGGDGCRRRLEPGEIVEIPDDMVMEDGDNLMEALWATGTIDLVPPNTPATRPLDYENLREAKLCSPTFKVRDPTDQRDMDKARAKVAARLLEQQSAPPPKKKADSPDADAPPPTPRSRRAARRKQAGSHGEAHIT